MRSVMQKRFSEQPEVQVPRSTFDRSHGLKTTFDAGYLVPCFLDEALPGDTLSLNMAGFATLATPIYPIMDNLHLETFFFAVPVRLLWENWKKFNGEKANHDDENDFLIPTVTINSAGNETIYDYFGLPTNIVADYEVTSLPFRAYNLIYNEWFKHQDLQDNAVVNIDDGPDLQADYELLRRCKKHDYFTSCLPWPQKGNSVMLSLGDSAPVTGIGKKNDAFLAANVTVRETGGELREYDINQIIGDGSDDTTFYVERDPNIATYPNIRADLANATASTVNELRQAIQMQRMLEKDARGGTRLVEIIKNHFGVTSPDARMQRPEYIGGGYSRIQVTPIARTDSSVGKLGAMGVSGFQGHGFTQSFTEHCYIIGLVNVRADLTYQEGLDRLWTRRSKYDFYWPTLAHLGEQAVLNKEIYLDAVTLGDESCDEVFGYQERFAEYRYKPSKITGKLRSNDAGTLDAWHLSTEFGDQPVLDADFIVDDPPLDRVIGTPSEPHFIMDCHFSYRCTRPMPMYAIPGFIDHF